MPLVQAAASWALGKHVPGAILKFKRTKAAADDVAKGGAFPAAFAVLVQEPRSEDQLPS